MWLQKYGLMDGQTDGQNNGQTDRIMDGHVIYVLFRFHCHSYLICVKSKSGLQTCGWTDRQTDGQKNGQTDRVMGGQTN